MSRYSVFSKYLLWTAGAVLAAFVLLVIASWIWIATFNLQAHRARIETLASQALARDVHIDGPLNFKFSLFPRISIGNVRIANAVWAAQPDFLSVEHIEVEISLLSLLRDKLVIRDLDLAGATIRLQRGPDQSANWVFKSGGRQGSAPAAMPDILALHASRVMIMYYPPDRPPVTVKIDEMQATLQQDEPLRLSMAVSFRNFPLKIELQGGTLAALLDSESRWPVKGTLDTDTRRLDFEGYISDPVAFREAELQIASEKQLERDSLLFGRSYEPVFDRYLIKMHMANDAGIYSLKLSGEAFGFDLSRIYEPGQRSQKPSVKIQSLKMSAVGSGSTVGDMLRSASTEAEGSGIEIRYPIGTPGQQSYPARIDTLRAKSTPGNGIEFSLNGTANSVPVQASASVKGLLYRLWKMQDVPLDVQLQSGAAQARFTGDLSKALDNATLEGNVSIRTDSLAHIGKLIGQHWPKSAALQATSQVRLDNRSLTLSNIAGQFGMQKASGEVTLSYEGELDLSIKAHSDRFELHDALQGGKIPANLAFDLSGLNLAINGKGPSLMQCILGGAWKISAGKGQIGWRPKPENDRYVYALHDIRLTAKDSEPVTLDARLSHHEVDLKLAARAGRLESLLDMSQAQPLDLQLSGQGLSATFKGALQNPAADITLVGDLEANGQLSTAARIFNVSLQQQQAAELRGHLAVTRNGLGFTDVVATSGGIDLKGDLDYQTSPTPHLAISSSGSSIDLGPYLKKNAGSARQPSRRSLIVPDIALDFSRYRTLDAAVTVNDLGIKYKGAAVATINASLAGDHGLFRLDPLEIRSAKDGTITRSSLELDSSRQVNRVKYDLQAVNIDYGDLLKRLEITNEVSGTLDLHMDLTGEGNDLRGLIRSANGKIQLVANKGLVPKWLLEIWGSGLLRIFLPTNWTGEPYTSLNCAVGSFDIADGIMQSKTLLADTSNVTVAGEINIDWRDEKIHGLFKPQPKDATLFHLGTPIELSGTLAYPKVASAQSSIVTIGKWAIGLSNPATMIVLFGDVGAKEKNPCAALLKQTAAVK